MIRVHTIPGALSAAECQLILTQTQEVNSRDAGLVGRNTDHNLRRADLVWVDDIPGAGWIMDNVVAIVGAANRDVFDFALQGFDESAQIARYDAARQGHFDWHADIGDGPLAARRKLTVVVQLSDPADYEGGTLEIMPSAQIIRAANDRGTATVFPSYLLHRVTPVTKGTRHSLTIWAHGPAFR